MIKFVVCNNDFLIPDLYSSFQEKNFFKIIKNDLIKFSKKFNKEYKNIQ